MVSEAVLDIAIEKLSSQEYTPTSPCEYSSQGGLQLCAAAAVAVAMEAVAGGDTAANEFGQELGETRDFGLVMNKFEENGVSAELCKKIFQRNDSLPHNSRTEEVIDFLRTELS